MFEVYHRGYDFPIAKFLYESDAEMFIDETRKRIPELADGYYIIDRRFSDVKVGFLEYLKRKLFGFK